MKNTPLQLRLPLLAAVLLACTAAAQQPPRIAAVVNAASSDSTAVGPGTVVVLWGEALGPPELAGPRLKSNGQFDDTLAGTRVFFNGVPAPLVYTSAHQVSAVAPFSLPFGAVTVQAEYQGVLSAPFVIATAPTAPGIFTLDSSGRGGAAALNQSGVVNEPGKPAAAGTVVAFYVTGAGQTDPPASGGQIYAAAAAIAQPVTVAIGGAEAQVEYAGAAPGMIAGVYQVNARVPAEAVSGDHVFLRVEIGGTRSQAGVTLAVTGTANSLPEPPAQLQVSAQEPGRARITWPGPAPEGVLRVLLERSTGAANGYAEIACVAASQLSYLDDSVAPSTTYYYRVRFETAAGYTRYSPSVPVTTLAQPPGPAGLRAAALPAGEVRLEWTAAAQADAVRIERRSSSGAWRELAAVPGAAGSYLDRRVSPATCYTYRVRLESSGVFSAYSAEAAAETPPFVAIGGPPRPFPPKGRRLQWNGAPWYPVGYTPALGALTSDQTDYTNFYKIVLDRLAANHINYMRAVFTMGQPYGDSMTVYQRTGPGLAADGRPKFDLTKFNQTYFDYWRAVAEYALAKGIVLQICVVDLWHNHGTVAEDNGPGKVWGMKYDFYHDGNNINGVAVENHTQWMSETHPVLQYHQALFRKLVDTMGDMPNIIWEAGNQTGRTDWELRMADFLTDYEQSRGLPVRLVMPRDLPGHQMVPGQHALDPAEVHAGLRAAFSRGVPLLAHNDGMHAGDAHDRRRRAWAALTAGAHINLFQLELADPAVLHSEDTADGMRYLGYLRTFLEELDVNLLGMKPSDDLASNGWAYARPGQEYVIYLAEGGATTIAGLPTAYTAVWFDPRNTRTQPAGAGPAFTAPGEGDWVLYIREQK